MIAVDELNRYTDAMLELGFRRWDDYMLVGFRPDGHNVEAFYVVWNDPEKEVMAKLVYYT